MTAQAVFLCGPDGVGKTTQSEMLVDSLRSKGLRVRYVWLRSSHLTSLPFLAYMRVAGYSWHEKLPNGGSIGFHDLSKNHFLSKIYEILTLLDMIIAAAVKIRLPLALGRNIVCDRFAVDTAVDVSVSTGKADFVSSPIGQLLLNLIPGDSVVIIFTADVTTIKGRRPENLMDPNLELRSRLYSELAGRKDWVAVDVNGKTKEVIHKEILNLIRQEE